MNQNEFEFIDGDKVKLLTDIKTESRTFPAGHTCSVIGVFRIPPNNYPNEIQYIIDPDFMDEEGSYEWPIVVKATQIVKSMNETEFL